MANEVYPALIWASISSFVPSDLFCIALLDRDVIRMEGPDIELHCLCSILHPLREVLGL